MAIFDLNKVYSFDLYPSGLLGEDFQNVEVLGTLSYSFVSKMPGDIEALHAQVFNTLPAGTVPNDPAAYDYILVRTVSGSMVYLGIPWIRPDSIRFVNAQTLDVVVGNATVEQIPLIRQMFAANNFNSVTITPRVSS